MKNCSNQNPLAPLWATRLWSGVLEHVALQPVALVASWLTAMLTLQDLQCGSSFPACSLQPSCLLACDRHQQGSLRTLPGALLKPLLPLNCYSLATHLLLTCCSLTSCGPPRSQQFQKGSKGCVGKGMFGKFLPVPTSSERPEGPQKHPGEHPEGPFGTLELDGTEKTQM